MEKVLKKIDENVDRFGYWAGAYLIVTGILSWLSKKLQFLEPYGWPEAIFFGLGAACVLMLTFAASLAAWRYFRTISDGANSSAQTGSMATEGALEPDKYMYDPQSEAPSIDAYHDIMGFALDYVLPACDAMFELQKKMIGELTDNEEITVLAISGLQSPLRQKTYEFWSTYDQITRGTNSSEPIIRYSVLVECIRGLERSGYRNFCGVLYQIAHQSEFDYKANEKTRPLWHEWRERHNALVIKYDKIKRDVRFGRLFSPRRDGRWGAIVEPD